MKKRVIASPYWNVKLRNQLLGRDSSAVVPWLYVPRNGYTEEYAIFEVDPDLGRALVLGGPGPAQQHLQYIAGQTPHRMYTPFWIDLRFSDLASQREAQLAHISHAREQAKLWMI